MQLVFLYKLLKKKLGKGSLHKTGNSICSGSEGGLTHFPLLVYLVFRTIFP